VNDHDRLLPAGDGRVPGAGPRPAGSGAGWPDGAGWALGADGQPERAGAQPGGPVIPSPDSSLAAGHAARTWPAPAELDQLADLVYERLAARLAQSQPGPQGEMPAVDEAAALRERAPELYDLWLKIAQDRAATGNYVRRAPYEVPERLAQSGRPRAVSSLVVVLAFCGYLAWLGGPGPYLAGLIAVFDLIVMLGLFFGLRPEHLSADRRPGAKRLPVMG
jgi:hypothetical protein